MKQLERMKAWVTSWRLPVRIPVPNRDNLIAMGLMALALGLITGVAIGPGLGPAGSAIAGVALPQTASVPEEPVVEEEVSDPGVELGTPAGSESLASTTPADDSSSLASVDPPPSDTTTEYPDPEPEPAEKEPANEIESNPDEPVEEVPEAEEGTALKGTVVGVDGNGRRYSLADSSGNVLVLFGSKPPVPGDVVNTHILPLSNGTFGESGTRKVTGINGVSKLRGIVSWIDPVTRLAVISNRGSSLAVDMSAIPAEQEVTIEPGSPVEGLVSLTDPVEATGTEPARPGLVATEMVATGEPSQRIELSGSLKSIDEAGHSLTMAADTNDLIPAEIILATPKTFPFDLVEAGRTYDVTAERAEDGSLTVTGLSPGYSRSSAEDAEAAFGDHG